MSGRLPLKARHVARYENAANVAVTDRPPPRRGGALGPPRRDGPTPSRRTAALIGDSAGPPLASFAAVVATLIFTAVSFWIGSRAEIGILSTGREIDFNTFGYVVGCFVSIGALYLFLTADNKARATRRYSEWRFIKARTAVVWLTFGSWTLGALHLLFWATDLTRP